jgi:hypothetical protein
VNFIYIGFVATKSSAFLLTAYRLRRLSSLPMTFQNGNSNWLSDIPAQSEGFKNAHPVETLHKFHFLLYRVSLWSFTEHLIFQDSAVFSAFS